MRFRPSHRLLGVLAAAALLAVTGACDPSTPTTTTTAPARCASPSRLTTVAYRTLPGVRPEAVSLDVRAPAGEVCDAPVVLWVHGGGYHTGDKANQMADKTALFNGEGWILVSINYRLTVAGDPTSAHYPDHYDDVAHAVAWVHDHIADYGGDPSRLALLGHSAGADIVSNVSTNPQYLQAVGLHLSDLACAGPLDTQGFDKPSAPASSQPQWLDALGNLSGYRTATSATLLVRPGIGIPPTIGVYRGDATRQAIEKAYLAALDAAGVPTRTIDARTLTHAEVNNRIGAAGDTVMTPPLVDFLTTTCFGPAN